MFRIMGTYQGKKEELDTAKNQKEADYLVKEYKIALGKQWTIVSVKKGEKNGIQGKR